MIKKYCMWAASSARLGLTTSLLDGPGDEKTNVLDDSLGDTTEEPAPLRPLRHRPTSIRSGGHGPFDARLGERCGRDAIHSDSLIIIIVILKRRRGRQTGQTLDAGVRREDGVPGHRRGDPGAQRVRDGLDGIVSQWDLHGYPGVGGRVVLPRRRRREGGDDQTDERTWGNEGLGLDGVSEKVD